MRKQNTTNINTKRKISKKDSIIDRGCKDIENHTLSDKRDHLEILSNDEEGDHIIARRTLNGTMKAAF